MRAQRHAVCQLPLLAEASAGVTIATEGFATSPLYPEMATDYQSAVRARSGNRADLAAALTDSRRQTLAGFAVYAEALPALGVPQRADLNPPLWELGHIGWFQEWWTVRNPDVAQGWRADPLAARAAPLLPGADALYDSSTVPHDSRWQLPLPDAGATRDYLAAGLEASLAALAAAGPGDVDLYFHRLALFHEDMHNEAAIYMAHGLGIALPVAAPVPVAPRGTWGVTATRHRLGWAGSGFAFDNELAGRTVDIGAFEIDAAPVSNARFAAFVDAGGYADTRFWSAASRAWGQEQRASAPRFWRRAASTWQQCWFGAWRDLEPDAAATNLNFFEAEAYCAWARRRLPSEAEWELAALTLPGLAWGEVWEWTADPFIPYPGFVTHPYRDYSAPWFGSRRVLRGASLATHARMRHPRYRNFFTPERNNIFAGFRTCTP